MEQQQPQISAKRSDSKSIQDYTNWLDISGHNGWLVYKKELGSLIEMYTNNMDNIHATPELLKNYQLIKKGLMMALNIPKKMEIKAKAIKKSEERKPKSRIDNFFRVGN